MKKRILVLSFVLLVVTGFLLLLSNKKNKVIYTEIDDIKYAIIVNGSPSNSFPNGNYKVDIECINADAFWDDISNKIIIKKIKGHVLCDIAFNSITNSDYLNTYVTSLSGTTQGNGQLVSENGLRYEGNNPNNYIMFNNELWRIIGVFSTEYDSNGNGIANSTTNLVKIIKEDSIGSNVWNKISSNDWPNSSLYHLLNEQYYDWETNKENVSTNCYGYYDYFSSHCDYSINGIQDGYRDMIVKAKWYLGGGGKSGYMTYTPDNIYSYERDANAIYSGRNASTLGYIGLMYESDYLYGVLKSDCEPSNNGARETYHSNYGNANCAGKDWLYSLAQEWTITPNSNNKYSVWSLSYGGHFENSIDNSPYYGHDVRPTLYLSPDVYRVSGTGSITDPYIIGMAS